RRPVAALCPSAALPPRQAGRRGGLDEHGAPPGRAGTEARRSLSRGRGGPLQATLSGNSPSGSPLQPLLSSTPLQHSSPATPLQPALSSPPLQAALSKRPATARG